MKINREVDERCEERLEDYEEWIGAGANEEKASVQCLRRTSPASLKTTHHLSLSTGTRRSDGRVYGGELAGQGGPVQPWLPVASAWATQMTPGSLCMATDMYRLSGPRQTSPPHSPETFRRKAEPPSVQWGATRSPEVMGEKWRKVWWVAKTVGKTRLRS